MRLRKHVLLAAMHHIVSDGWSLGVLVREVSAIYGAVVRGATAPWPEVLGPEDCHTRIRQKGLFRERQSTV